MSNVIEQQGSVRIDLVGGTIDLEPIALLLQDTVTLNMATTLKAKVIIEKTNKDGVSIYSKDYERHYFYANSDFTPENFYYEGRITTSVFKEMLFVVLICKHFGVTKNIHLELSSGAPAGSGLGGSSAMAITLAKALLKLQHKTCDEFELISQVRKTEEMILNRGVAGYQDYFPAVFGGILALKPDAYKIKVEQLYQKKLSDFLSANLTLVYSGKSRLSGINNWEVYKAYFDGDLNVINGLREIASISKAAYTALCQQDWFKLLDFIAQEGAIREKLFSNIVTKEMKQVHERCLKILPTYKGMKVCGAGGGGCFLLVGVGLQQAATILAEFEMQALELEIAPPLDLSLSS